MNDATDDSDSKSAPTVLVVEDDELVQKAARRILTRAGYRVLDTTDPFEALTLAERHANEIQLLLTDVVIPKMKGPSLARRVLEHIPGLPIVYMSGYADDDTVHEEVVSKGLLFLEKPFDRDRLVHMVGRALGVHDFG
jgi:DNA-binding NtrC family response regulator